MAHRDFLIRDNGVIFCQHNLTPNELNNYRTVDSKTSPWPGALTILHISQQPHGGRWTPLHPWRQPFLFPPNAQPSLKNPHWCWSTTGVGVTQSHGCVVVVVVMVLVVVASLAWITRAINGFGFTCIHNAASLPEFLSFMAALVFNTYSFLWVLSFVIMYWYVYFVFYFKYWMQSEQVISASLHRPMDMLEAGWGDCFNTFSANTF